MHHRTVLAPIVVLVTRIDLDVFKHHRHRDLHPGDQVLLHHPLARPAQGLAAFFEGGNGNLVVSGVEDIPYR
ncbi:MAG: hypothetical protein ACK4LB_05605 [Spirosomataceae bacterium]